jgi:hypothetical protein
MGGTPPPRHLGPGLDALRARDVGGPASPRACSNQFGC